MFLFYFLFVCILYSSVFGQFKCPINNSSKPIDGAYRDPNNCGIYYHCIDGTPFLQSCPPGLHFQIKTDSCKFTTCIEPRFSDCRQKITSKDNSNKAILTAKNGKDDIDECEPNKNETVGNFFDCRSYFHCVNGIAFSQRCPTGYFFTPKLDFTRCVTRFCVPLDEAECPIDGEWSSWSDWTECEGACNSAGVRRRYRECNNPPPMNNGDDCEGNAVEEEVCVVYCPITPSFMVSLQSYSFIPEGVVNWTQVDLNNNNLYNPIEANVNIKEFGVYFFALTGTIGGDRQIQLRFSGAGLSPGLRRDSYWNTLITLSREALIQLTPAFSPTIQQRTPTNFFAGSKMTSWLGFKYETENYFFAATNANFNIIVTNGTVNLPIYQMRGFSQNGYRFRSADSGYFYISYGVGAAVGNSFTEVFLNGISADYQRIYGQNVQNVSDTWVKNFIFDSRNIAPEFVMHLYTGNLFSGSDLEVYMMAFKLKSNLPMFTVKGPETERNSTITIVKFRSVVVDNFNGWNRNEYYYRIPSSGIYYISVNIPVCFYNSVTRIYVRVNSQRELYFSRDSRELSSSVLTSSSILLDLRTGDKVAVYYEGCISYTTNEAVLNIFKV